MAFVRACGADEAEWRRRWQALAEQVGAARPQPSSDSAVPAATAATPRWSPPHRRVLPAQLPMAARLVGRKAELATARALLEPPAAGRPLVISGPVGVGKSAFALWLAKTLSAQWPDGQLYADLGGQGPLAMTSPWDVAAGFLDALGVTAAQLPAEPAQRVALYRSLLAGRRVLVLLDGALDEDQVRPLLLPSAGSQVIVTSRSRLLGLDGADRQQLGVLTREESVAMIGMAHLRAEAKAEVEVEAEAERLAELCSDLPLALSVAIRKIAARPEWPPAYTVGQLAGGNLLDLLRVGDVSVRGRLVSSYERQDPLARAVFNQLGASHSTRSAAASVAAANVAATMTLPVTLVEDRLDALLDAGLLLPAKVAGRYRMPELFRLFAAEQQAVAQPADQSSRPPTGSHNYAKPAGRRRIEWWFRRHRFVFINCSARSILPINVLPRFR